MRARRADGAQSRHVPPRCTDAAKSMSASCRSYPEVTPCTVLTNAISQRRSSHGGNPCTLRWRGVQYPSHLPAAVAGIDAV